MAKIKADSVDDYIAAAPPEARKLLREIRALLRQVAPEANETIKWGTPVFEEARILFAFSAHKHHLNFMPTRKTLKHFTRELENYKTGADTVQLAYDKPLPKTLIRKIARARVKDVRENDAKWM